MKVPEFRMYLALSDADREEGNQIAVEVGKGEANRFTYDTPLINEATGELWWACNTVASQAMVSKMEAAMLAGRVPSVKFALLRNLSLILISTNSFQAFSHRGVVFSFDGFLTCIDRTRVVPPMEGI